MVGEMNSKLVDHGIQTEESDIRVHVAPATRSVIVFKTAEALRAISSNRYPLVTARQVGFDGITAEGYLVPWKDISDHIRLTQKDFYGNYWWKKFDQAMGTPAKGQTAVDFVLEMLNKGRFPLWADSQAVKDIEIDKAGTDILVRGVWRIQVKCDFRAGPSVVGGTGNLFIQVAECNPLRRY